MLGCKNRGKGRETAGADAEAIRNFASLRHDFPSLSKMEVFIRNLKEEQIERYGLRSFIILFFLFNLIYWPWLLVASRYFNWELDFTYNINDFP
jgi:hypothetical protein